MGGQTALNCALDLAREGVLEQYGVEMIGATRRPSTWPKTVSCSTGHEGYRSGNPRARIAHSMEEALQVLDQIGFPCIIRPSFTMGGSGGGIAYNREEFEEICERGLDLSPTNELLIDESLIGWKEFEMEVVRDNKDNCIIICSIENFDAMGVHTGDSITVAPAQTLTDKEYQIMRNASLAVLREIGVETGGSNVQFGADPKTGRLVIIEMNPGYRAPPPWHPRPPAFPLPRWRPSWPLAIPWMNCRTILPAGRRRRPSSRPLTMWLPRFRALPLRNSPLPIAPDHADEICGRGHGHRPHLPGVTAESAAGPGSGLRRL